ncbi:hypothetical protein MG293_014053 [Ovis ammon polii]|uniref:Uncharacterized protein n=1 Tax=Ovis ammon polii TaxID=230172 RepID=A0AAD4TZJ3_OVIAM|nr:hypothetical protein MG293_014053 [Ovis ammon polii]
MLETCSWEKRNSWAMETFLRNLRLKRKPCDLPGGTLRCCRAVQRFANPEHKTVSRSSGIYKTTRMKVPEREHLSLFDICHLGKTECVLSTESMYMAFFQEKGKQEDSLSQVWNPTAVLPPTQPVYFTYLHTQQQTMYLKGNRNERRHRLPLGPYKLTGQKMLHTSID